MTKLTTASFPVKLSGYSKAQNNSRTCSSDLIFTTNALDSIERNAKLLPCIANAETLVAVLKIGLSGGDSSSFESWYFRPGGSGGWDLVADVTIGDGGAARWLRWLSFSGRTKGAWGKILCSTAVAAIEYLAGGSGTGIYGRFLFSRLFTAGGSGRGWWRWEPETVNVVAGCETWVGSAGGARWSIDNLSNPLLTWE